VRREGGSWSILCRKATKISRKQIKEDVSKHQRRACSTAFEGFRGNEAEIVNGKSLLCFPSPFGKTSFTVAQSSFQGASDVPRQRLTACPAAGQAGCEGTAAGVRRGSQGTRLLTPCSPVAQNEHLSSNGHCSSLGLRRKTAFSGKCEGMWFD